MMQIERWIAGASIRVYPYAANNVVPGGMNTSISTIDSLESSIKAGDIITARDEFRHVCWFGLIAPGKGEVP